MLKRGAVFMTCCPFWEGHGEGCSGAGNAATTGWDWKNEAGVRHAKHPRAAGCSAALGRTGRRQETTASYSTPSIGKPHWRANRL